MVSELRTIKVRNWHISVVVVQSNLFEKARNGEEIWGEDRLGDRYSCILRAIPKLTIQFAGRSLLVAMEVQPR